MTNVGSLRRNIGLLAAAQALLVINASTLVSLNGLVGYALASNKLLATLPNAIYVVGSALSTVPAAFFMQRVGRKLAFLVGGSLALSGAAVCTFALSRQDFGLFCAGNLLIGGYAAFGQQYRFAGAEAANADFKATAISLVLAGGIIGAIVGPESSKLTKGLFTTPYLGAYASLLVFGLLALGVVSFLQIAAPAGSQRRGGGRSLGEIARQPAFIVAVLSSALGWGVMNLLMTATPLAMTFSHHAFSSTAFVIEGHILGMYVPGFFTGMLIHRFGVLNVLLAGVCCMASTVIIALSGLAVHQFWFALVLLGVGWNFMFTGGTALLTESYEPAERATAQGFNDLVMFSVMGVSSLSAGALVNTRGWATINVSVTPLLVVAALAVVWLMVARRRMALSA